MNLKPGMTLRILGPRRCSPHINCTFGMAIELAEGAPYIEDPVTDPRVWVREDGIYRLDGGCWVRWLVEAPPRGDRVTPSSDASGGTP